MSLREDFLTETIWDAGTTPEGERVHFVDFKSNSALALGSDDPDKLLCGRTSDADTVSDPNLQADLCERCLERAERMAEYLLSDTERPEERVDA